MTFLWVTLSMGSPCCSDGGTSSGGRAGEADDSCAMELGWLAGEEVGASLLPAPPSYELPRLSDEDGLSMDEAASIEGALTSLSFDCISLRWAACAFTNPWFVIAYSVVDQLLVTCCSCS